MMLALIWLGRSVDDREGCGYLNTNASALFIDEVMAARTELKFNNPAVDSRTPISLFNRSTERFTRPRRRRTRSTAASATATLMLG